MQLEIYSTPNCEYCQKAKEFFDEMGFEYIEHDATDPVKKAEAQELTGRIGVPVIKLTQGEIVDVFLGWNQEEFVKTLV